LYTVQTLNKGIFTKTKTTTTSYFTVLLQKNYS